MVSNTSSSSGEATASDLSDENNYRHALRSLRDEIRQNPSDERLLIRLADLYIAAGKEDRANKVLLHLADHFATHGHPAKAVAALKKLELETDATATYERIAALIHDDEQLQHEDMELSIAEDEIDIGPISHSHSAHTHDDDMRMVEAEHVMDDTVPTPLFDDFSREELLAFMRGLQLHIFDPGDIVVAQGDPGDSLFILTTGIVKAYVRDGDRFRHVRTLHDGDFFGEISILSGGPRTATVTAATHCELLELDRASLDEMSAKHPRVTEILRRYYDERTATA